MRCSWMSFWGGLGLAVALLSLTTEAVAEPLSYARDVRQPGGEMVPLTFAGDYADGVLTGVLAFGDVSVDVTGRFGDRRLRGTFQWVRGGSAGAFTGWVDGDTLRGTYELDGQRGQWSVPLTQVPASARTLLE